MSKASNIAAIIKAHKGQFFSVSFIKKDGTLRTIKNAQFGHKKGHDGKNPVAHIDHYLTVVENMGGGNYQHRTVNADTVQRLCVAGVEYTF